MFTATGSRPQSSLNGHKRRVNPSAYKAFTLNSSALAGRLAAAPDEAAKGAAPATLQLPAPNGGLVTFNIVESTIMESELAAAHPRSRPTSGAASPTRAPPCPRHHPDGLPRLRAHARGGDDWYVDPAYNGADSLVPLLLLGATAGSRSGAVTEPARSTRSARGHRGRPTADGARATQVKQRTYRLALITDPTYATYFGTANVLAEKVTLINRVNQVYNDDLAIRLRLVNETDKLNLDTAAEATGANGPCGGPRASRPVTRPAAAARTSARATAPCSASSSAPPTTTSATSALGTNGGGIAFLGVVGGDYKGGGCTGLPTPKGDFFAIDYVAHEMGHQFAGNHTFNGAQPAAPAATATRGTSVEPGRGSSVMAYAGICRQDNLQPHTDPYFSQRTRRDHRLSCRDTDTSTRCRRSRSRASTAPTPHADVRPAPRRRSPAATTTARIDAAIEALTGDRHPG